MRTLTVNGFFRQYVKKLSVANTLDLGKLAAEATAGNYRLQAPLVLYAVSSGKKNALIEHLSHKENSSEMLAMLSGLSSENLGNMLAQKDVPEEYQKAWKSFLAARNAPARDEALKDAMRIKVLSLLRQKQCSNYRVYHDLHLNPGNVNAWLKNGDSRKVSYATAERILNYVLQH